MRVAWRTERRIRHGARRGSQQSSRSVPCVACYLLSDPVKQMNVKSEASRTISPKRPFFKISVLMTNQSCFVAPLGAVCSHVGCDLRAAARRGIPGIRRVFLCFLVCLATCFLSRGARVCAQVRVRAPSAACGHTPQVGRQQRAHDALPVL